MMSVLFGVLTLKNNKPIIKRGQRALGNLSHDPNWEARYSLISFNK